MSNQGDDNGSLSLLVVILNYRTPSLTIDCLQSLVSEVQALPDIKVIVTDNASGDESVQQIGSAIERNNWGSWVSLMPLDRNGGFAFGNNAPIRAALDSANLPPYVLLLNPDTVIRPDALHILLDFMNANPEVGIAGSRLEDLDGTPQHSAFRFHTLLSEIDSGLRLGLVSKLLNKWVVAPPISEQACQTDWVAGASMIIRRQVLEAIGLMDEGYFMYYEEMDFCLQANRAGWSCWYVPQSQVVHFVGQSSGVTNKKTVPKRLPQYWFESRQRYFLKNYGWLYAVLADAAWASSFAIWRLRRTIQRKPDPDPPNLFSDFLLNSLLLKGGQV
jgi:N-acetylglucosaminyl-diphospho-decaprenol L-rhamnosyltransferase